jgi:hypothetical protein
MQSARKGRPCSREPHGIVEPGTHRSGAGMTVWWKCLLGRCACTTDRPTYSAGAGNALGVGCAQRISARIRRDQGPRRPPTRRRRPNRAAVPGRQVRAVPVLSRAHPGRSSRSRRSRRRRLLAKVGTSRSNMAHSAYPRSWSAACRRRQPGRGHRRWRCRASEVNAVDHHGKVVDDGFTSRRSGAGTWSPVPVPVSEAELDRGVDHHTAITCWPCWAAGDAPAVATVNLLNRPRQRLRQTAGRAQRISGADGVEALAMREERTRQAYKKAHKG